MQERTYNAEQMYRKLKLKGFFLGWFKGMCNRMNLKRGVDYTAFVDGKKTNYTLTRESAGKIAQFYATQKKAEPTF